MFIDISKFASSPQAIDVTFARPAMKGTTGSGEDVRVVATGHRMEAGVRLSGHLETRVTLVCARCGDVFSMPVETDFSLLYRLGTPVDPPASEVLLAEEECRLVDLDEQGRIDLLGLAREEVYLCLPLKPICRSECRGLCSQCGANLNTRSCTCPGPEGEHRWGPLADLKDRLSRRN